MRIIIETAPGEQGRIQGEHIATKIAKAIGPDVEIKIATRRPPLAP